MKKAWGFCSVHIFCSTRHKRYNKHSQNKNFLIKVIHQFWDVKNVLSSGRGGVSGGATLFTISLVANALLYSGLPNL